MRTTIEFLDAMRVRHCLRSDYQLAKFLGVRQQTISNYRNRKSGFDEAMAIKVADALGLDHAHVLACIAAERAKSEAVKKAWQRAAAATAAVLAALTIADHGADLVASAVAMVDGAAAPSMYIMLNAALFLAAAFAAALLSRPRQQH